MQESALHHQTGSRPNGHRECGSAASSGQGSLAWPRGAQLRRPAATASRPHAAESAQKSLAIARCACSRPHMESMSPIDDVGQRWASDVVHGHSCHTCTSPRGTRANFVFLSWCGFFFLGADRRYQNSYELEQRQTRRQRGAKEGAKGGAKIGRQSRRQTAPKTAPIFL